MLYLKSVLNQTALRCNAELWTKIKTAKRDVGRRAKSDPRHHWIFDHFRAYRGNVPTNFHVTYIGDRVRDDIVDWEGHRSDEATAPDLPPFDCEYFEWMDVLEAVHAASQTFTMLEVGAGYGRWSSRAALAAAQVGKTARFGLVEADPKHLVWLKQCLQDNGITEESYKVFEGVVAGVPGKSLFQVELPEPAKVSNWFGQAIARRDHAQLRIDNDSYYGHRKMCGHDGAFIEVKQFTLTEILRSFDRIDLVHMDIQGAESEAIQEGLELLKQRVARVSIGTHGHDIEDRLKLMLMGSGWVCLRDYRCHQINDTDFGPIQFVDGLQSWINPTLL